MKSKVIKIYKWILISLALYALFLAITDIEIPCFYLKATGMKCAGCGITRMLLSMLKLDFFAAFNYNPVMFIYFWIWNVIGLLCIWGKCKIVEKPAFLYTVLSVFILTSSAFWFLRNI